MVDYSKWKNIEVSDDEDDTHPNIDTPSLFKWRHEARIQRMQEQEEERKAFQKRKEEVDKLKREAEVKKKGGADVSTELEKLSMEEKKIKEEEEEIQKKDRLTPWNVDTIGQPGFSKTVINTSKPLPKEELTEEQKATRLHEFTKKYEKELKQFGLLRKYDDSKKFLTEYPELACEDTANYLTFWCIDLAMEGKNSLLDHVSHQAIAIQFLLELAKQTERDPRTCAASFFSKMGHVEQSEYKEGFDTELRLFRERIRKRADQKIKEAMEEEEKLEREERIKNSPGGLDWVEVLETLPEKLRKCFEERDIPSLHVAIKEMPIEEAEYHMKRCVDSGLWDPEGNKTKKEEGEEEEAESEYAEVGPPPEASAVLTEEAQEKSRN